MEQHFYLIIDLAAFLPVFILSFDEKVAFWKRKKAIFTAIALVALPFLIWDAIFTHFGYWGFNTVYLGGLNIVNLPIEEVLFFVAIPYASLFVFQVLQDYHPKAWIEKLGRPFVLLAGLAVIAGLAMSNGRWYPLLTGGLLLPSMLFAFWKNPKWLGHFALAWLILLIPFLMLNGILTGTGIKDQIVWYNAEQILGLRVGTIPIEDFFYGMLLIFWNCFLFERFKLWKPKEEIDYYKHTYKTHG